MKLILKAVIMLFSIEFLMMSCNQIEKSPSNESAPKKGHLYLTGNRVFFGTIDKKFNKTVKMKCILYNTGGTPIVIHKVDVSCGCISADLLSKVIKPHQSVILIIYVNTEKQIGYFNKSIFINSNADNPIQILRIKGNIIE